jgi:AraC-like DNA-binding protein
MKCLLIAACIIASAPTQQTKTTDSLTRRNYAYLAEAVSSNSADTALAKIYARAWITRAKARSDAGPLCDALRAMMYLVNDEMQMTYADSILTVAHISGDHTVLGSAYLSRGALFYSKKKHAKALDEFMLADKFISRTTNKYLKFKIKYVIAQSKFHLGYYEEAIALYRQCLPYFRVENDRAYLNTLHALAVSYISIGRHDLAAAMVKIGESESMDQVLEDMLPYFRLADGMNEYHLGNSPKTIQDIRLAISGPTIRNDFANYATAQAYLGRANWALKQYREAIVHFKSVDSIFSKTGYIKPDLRDCYVKMVGYYRQSGDQEKQLFYSDRLIEIHKVFERDYVYLSRTLTKEYEDRKKSELQEQTALRAESWKHAALVGIIMLSGLAGIFYIRNRRNRRRYFELMSPSLSKSPIPREHKEIDDKLVRAVILKLDEFEETNRYLAKDTSLRAIARFLGTNPKYASMIISKYRGKGYIQYVADLKIDYIVEKLKTDRAYRNYTIKALAKLAGFGSTQVFTKSFKERTGIMPSYFCKMLRTDM